MHKRYAWKELLERTVVLEQVQVYCAIIQTVFLLFILAAILRPNGKKKSSKAKKSKTSGSPRQKSKSSKESSRGSWQSDYKVVQGRRQNEKNQTGKTSQNSVSNSKYDVPWGVDLPLEVWEEPPYEVMQPNQGNGENDKQRQQPLGTLDRSGYDIPWRLELPADPTSECKDNLHNGCRRPQEVFTTPRSPALTVPVSFICTCNSCQK